MVIVTKERNDQVSIGRMEEGALPCTVMPALEEAFFYGVGFRVQVF